MTATVVLVHGAWHGPWCWERVIELLDAHGVRSVAVDLPSCDESSASPGTLADDAAVVRAAIERVGGPSIVVGHSYGGAVITAAAAGCADVERLLYLAAFMLDNGESVPGVLNADGPPPLVLALRRTDGGRTFVDPTQVTDLFYADCDSATQKWAAAKLRTMSSASAEAPAGIAWKEIPSTFIICAEDKAIPPPIQRSMAVHATEVVELQASHSPFVSQPDKVADVIERIARES